MNKFEIHGIVKCPCGGIIITKTGKTFGKFDLGKLNILCWDCKKVYNADEVFNQRKKNKTIVFKKNEISKM